MERSQPKAYPVVDGYDYGPATCEAYQRKRLGFFYDMSNGMETNDLMIRMLSTFLATFMAFRLYDYFHPYTYNDHACQYSDANRKAMEHRE